MRSSRNFLRGGGGGGGGSRLRRFFSPQLILQRGGGAMVSLQRKLYFPKDPEGVQHFQGRSIQGGIQMLIAITITCDFLGRWGGGGGLRGSIGFSYAVCILLRSF